MPPYTQPSATAQGFRYGQPNMQRPGPSAQRAAPSLPPNPFGSSSGGYSQYGAPSGGFGGFSQLGQYSGSMTPFQGGTNPFGMSSGGYSPSLGSGSPYSSLGGAQGWGAQFDPTSQFVGSQGGASGMAAGGYDFAPPLPPGGVYGDSKWMPGNGSDIFVPRGTPIFAMFDGVVEPNPMMIPSPVGPVPSFLLRGSNGITMQATHAQMTARGQVRKGQQIGVVNDPGMDILGPYQGMPDGFQHLDLTIGHGGPFPLQGGDLNARQALEMSGYQGRRVPGATRGPNGGGGGGSMFGGPGGGQGFGGMPSGMPGMPPGMGSGGPMGGLGGFPGAGNPFGGLGGPMGFSGAGSGMPPFGNPFMSMLMPQMPQMSPQIPQMPQMSLPSFSGFGAGPSPMSMGLGNPFSFGGGGGPMGAAGMMMNPFGGLGPAGAASMYGA